MDSWRWYRQTKVTERTSDAKAVTRAIRMAVCEAVERLFTLSIPTAALCREQILVCRNMVNHWDIRTIATVQPYLKVVSAHIVSTRSAGLTVKLIKFHSFVKLLRNPSKARC